MLNCKRMLTALTLTALVASSLAASGCTGFSRKGQYRAHPTPGVYSIAKTNDEVNNNWYYMTNTNYRALIDDFGRFTLISRPSRMIYSATPF